MFVICRQMMRMLPIFLLSFIATETVAAQMQKVEKTASRTKLVFAVSWQPGFCRTRPDRPECRAQTVDGFGATNFTLHGLWPVGKSYCGVDAAIKTQDRKGKWLELPPLALSGDAAGMLATAMPGVQSGLDRHQWVRSGRCHSATAGAYFDEQLRYLAFLNRSAVRDLFVSHLGKPLTEQDVRQAFDAGFGAGAGDRVRLQCAKVGKDMVVTGLTLGLGEPAEAATMVKASATVAGVTERANGEMDGGSQLPALVLAADAISGKCSSGIVSGVEGQ